MGSLEYSVLSSVCCAVISAPGLTSELLMTPSREEARDLGADLDRVGRLRLRHVLVVDGDRAWLHLDYRHLGRWRRLRLCFARAAAEDDGSGAERERPARNSSELMDAYHEIPSF